MLKKIHRLSSSKDIRLTSLRGRSFFSPFFVVKYNSGSELRPRLTVIVSTKTSKLAVERNRIKRIIRESLRQSVGQLKPGNYIIIVKARAAKKTAAEIRQNLDQLLLSVHLKK